MSEDLRTALEKLEARHRAYDTMVIADAWVAMAKQEHEKPLVTAKGMAIQVRRVPQGNRVEYLVMTTGWRKKADWPLLVRGADGRPRADNQCESG